MELSAQPPVGQCCKEPSTQLFLEQCSKELSAPSVLAEFLQMPQPPAKLSKKIKGKARVLTSKEHLQIIEEKEKKKKEEAELSKKGK